ncbi:glycosyl transferase family 2 [Gelidibacter algens]|uniref:Glycosyl transferase family 2 n=1 Tax=Gelidibacter algens TaxID=49280 RepID=A0A1A7QQL8_9FLAO|nr:glycosyltransferase [Gelidibacter algens]OBX21494.1 family 2 glycosyl transferase [Gelidibacter algens]RAJ25216.1 glycosyl transferase family 2 [Gelidibacter algens]
MTKFKTWTSEEGEILLYVGDPDVDNFKKLIDGPGDLWHSSLDQGFRNCFPELIYQTAVYWWFLNDFENVNSAVNWRVNSRAFVIRKSVWEQLPGFDKAYSCEIMQGLDFGFNFIRYNHGIPMYVKGLFPKEHQNVKITSDNRYLFFKKHFKKRHSYYMLLRQGLLRFINEYKSFKKSSSIKMHETTVIKGRPLKPIIGHPKVSLIIPTMKRQGYTELLLKDYNAQTYPICEAIIVDATPEEERDPKYYNEDNFNFKINLKWQTSKGSCKARNEAIDMCIGDYIIFADDDIRVLPDFVENHIKLLQTYKADATNGLDIMASHETQDLNDLKNRLAKLGDARWHVGVSSIFSNANSCVKKEMVDRLKGNDINFDGGYGEDSDYGLRILKAGGVLLHNPYSANLHLKPQQGGYRVWGSQSKLMGKKRKTQPWELDRPVKWPRPVPSPTITYGIIKHFTPEQVEAWRHKHFFLYLFKGGKKEFLVRLLKLPYKQLQFQKSLQYAKRLLYLGERHF